MHGDLMKRKIVTIITLLSLNAWASEYNYSFAPDLAGRCKASAIEAAQKVLINGMSSDLKDDEDIFPDEYEQDVYDFDYVGDYCTFRAVVKIKPIKLSPDNKFVEECQILDQKDATADGCK
jgi:hypothetical protein